VRRALLLLIPGLLLAGCEPLALSMVGAGAGAVLRHNLFEGVTYRTFTAAPPMVLGASLVALDRMGLNVQSHARHESGDVIVASSDNRNIEIEFEPVSSSATRVRIAARSGGPFFDTATANEIIAQTERVLDSAANYRHSLPGPNRI
jgi:hypothetical protein